MKPEWCPQEMWQAASMAVVHAPEYTQRLHEDVARALLDAHQRGRREGMEEAAKVAERDGSSHEDTGAYNHDQTVQIRTADRIAAAIRAKAQEVSL